MNPLFGVVLEVSWLMVHLAPLRPPLVQRARPPPPTPPLVIITIIIIILVIITIIPRKKQSKHTNYHAACLYHNRDDVSWGGSATHGIYAPLVFYRSHTWLKTLRPATSAIRNAIEHGRRSSRVFS